MASRSSCRRRWRRSPRPPCACQAAVPYPRARWSGPPGQRPTRSSTTWASPPRGARRRPLPRRATQARVGAEWLLHALAGGGELIRLGFLAQRTGTLADFEHTDAGLNQEETTAALTAAGEI